MLDDRLVTKACCHLHFELPAPESVSVTQERAPIHALADLIEAASCVCTRFCRAPTAGDDHYQGWIFCSAMRRWTRIWSCFRTLASSPALLAAACSRNRRLSPSGVHLLQFNGINRNTGGPAEKFEQQPDALLRAHLLDGAHEIREWPRLDAHLIARLKLGRRQQAP